MTNYGLVLIDDSGYARGSPTRAPLFSARPAPMPVGAPKLKLEYAPDAPFADAGPDQENLNWDGSALRLVGSGSYDPPGGSGAGLSMNGVLANPRMDPPWTRPCSAPRPLSAFHRINPGNGRSP